MKRKAEVEGFTRSGIAAAVLASCLATLILLAPLFAADRAKTLRRLSVGDMVRFVDGAGLDLAEVLAGPDPSNYYLLSGPDGNAVSVPREKLRLVQSAGTKQAPFNRGDIVDRKLRPRGTERGEIVRVNGAFCEVKTKEADANWFECRELRRVTPRSEPRSERQDPDVQA